MAENENSLSPSNSTQAMGWNYFNWCKDYQTAPIIWSGISAICFLLGFPASLWVLYELLKRQRQRSTNDIFMFSLAVLDLGFTAQVPFCVCNFMVWHNMELQNILVFVYSLSIGRPLFMACMCWDCYVAVVYPIMYKTSKKLIVIKKALTITICCTVMVAGLVASNMQWLITTPLMAFPLSVSLPVIAFCDISIFRALRKPDPTGNNKIHPQKKQALQTITNSFIMTFLVYLPPMIIFFFGQLMLVGESKRFCSSAPYGFSFSTVGCVIMPVLYLVSMGKLGTCKNCWKK